MKQAFDTACDLFRSPRSSSPIRRICGADLAASSASRVVVSWLAISNGNVEAEVWIGIDDGLPRMIRAIYPKTRRSLAMRSSSPTGTESRPRRAQISRRHPRWTPRGRAPRCATARRQALKRSLVMRQIGLVIAGATHLIQMQPAGAWMRGVKTSGGHYGAGSSDSGPEPRAPMATAHRAPGDQRPGRIVDDSGWVGGGRGSWSANANRSSTPEAAAQLPGRMEAGLTAALSPRITNARVETVASMPCGTLHRHRPTGGALPPPTVVDNTCGRDPTVAAGAGRGQVAAGVGRRCGQRAMTGRVERKCCRRGLLVWHHLCGIARWMRLRHPPDGLTTLRRRPDQPFLWSERRVPRVVAPP